MTARQEIRVTAYGATLAKVEENAAHQLADALGGDLACAKQLVAAATFVVEPEVQSRQMDGQTITDVWRGTTTVRVDR